MTQSKTKKTNMHWYPYEEHGCYYKFENGELLYAAMLKDGSIDIDGDEVNFGVVEYTEEQDQARMLEIVKELQQKE